MSRGFIGEQRQFNQRMESSIGELSNNVARQGDAIGELSNNVARQGDAISWQGDAIGELRGNAARQVVGAHFEEITDGMGFQFKRLLARSELGQMIFQRETDDIPQSDRRSFFRADLVIEATDSEGAIHYIAVEGFLHRRPTRYEPCSAQRHPTHSAHWAPSPRRHCQRPQRPRNPGTDRQRHGVLVRSRTRRLHT